MKDFLIISQIVISLLLILSILSQEKGAGLSAAFGGGSEVFRSKRGIDRILHWITVALVVLFIVNALSFSFLKDTTASLPGLSIEDLGVTATPVTE
ncbi:MAG: preprotein translocase subunit SecG [Patescibacteria group bacterium]